MSALLSGCYYLQAAQGQLEVLNKRVQIAALVEDPETPDELGARLQLVREARRFSISELRLPDSNADIATIRIILVVAPGNIEIVSGPVC